MLNGVENTPAQPGTENNPVNQQPAASPAPGTPPAPTGTETFEIVVSGEKRAVTLEELKTMASESAGAQRRFQEAAELRKSAERGIRIQTLADKLKGNANPNEAEVMELAQLLGADMNNQQAQNPPQQGQQNPPSKQVVRREDLDPGVQDAIRAAEDAELAKIRSEIESETKKGIDSDPVISTMISGLVDERQKALKPLLFEMALEDVKGQIFAGAQFGPALIQSVAQKMRTRLKVMGIGAPAQQANPSTAGPGSSYGDGGLNLNQRIDRVPAGKDNYISNVVQRTQQMMQRAAAGLKIGGSR